MVIVIVIIILILSFVSFVMCLLLLLLLSLSSSFFVGRMERVYGSGGSGFRPSESQPKPQYE